MPRVRINHDAQRELLPMHELRQHERLQLGGNKSTDRTAVTDLRDKPASLLAGQITRSPDHPIRQSPDSRRLPQMREKQDLLRIPNEELEYQPAPETVAGFIASMASRVDELLSGMEFRSILE
jgi:hypothetical protein